MFYHVRMTRKSDLYYDRVRVDLSEDELEDRFLIPYRRGRPIVIGGETVPPDDLHRIRINRTDQSSNELLPVVRAERAHSGVISTTPDEWYIADKGEEVTDHFIKGPPGSERVDSQASADIKTETPKDPRVVFVVHGRNRRARDGVFTFLRSLGLQPLEWSEAVQATATASPYVGDVLDKAFSLAQAIVVLITPDDEARLREEFREEGDPPHETEVTPQARPNVLFEAGMAMGRDPERTVLVELGDTRPFSDIGGRHVIRLSDSSQKRQELALRLQAAGCAVNMSGTDWHTAGHLALD